MKEWLTAREIADERLPGMPTTQAGIWKLAEADGWDSHPSFYRKREGRGGGYEYNYQILPPLAQIAYAQKHMAVAASTAGEPQAEDTSMSARARLERDARLAILDAYSQFTRGLQLGHATHLQVFCAKYNFGSIKVDDWVREIVPSLSKRTLMRWKAARKAGKTASLARDPGQARKGTGVLETANDGAVRGFILGLLAHNQFLSAAHIRTLCRDEFGDRIEVLSKGVRTAVEMPPIRTFQHAIAALKVSHKVELTKLTNPDLYRSTMKPSGVGALRHVTEANQLWQIDASPVDALCTDGRHSVYVCIDIATRRQVFSLSRTPRASAVALLIRKAILAWGVPDRIKTDNGSDFVARDTKRLLSSLGIEVELSDAYSPEQKGHVERAIGTFQRDLGTLLPGFIGHSVADRKAIEGRKSFAQRLGESDADTFSVSLSAAELQTHVDQWADLVQQHKPHAGLKGRTPAEAALASIRAKRTVDERALDLLLMAVAGTDGRRVVTKFGIRIDGRQYLVPTVMSGTTVFVRQDPLDMGKAYVFAEDGGAFLGVATCAELSGVDPQAFVREAKAMQREMHEKATRPIADEMRRIKRGATLIDRALGVARRDAEARAEAAGNVIPLPRREEQHCTPQIAAAIEAMGEQINPSRTLNDQERAAHQRLIAEMEAEEAARVEASFAAKYQARMDEIEAARTAVAAGAENVVVLPETPKGRYRRAVEARRRIDAGLPIETFDAVWVGRYEASAEFRGQKAMHDDFGDAYLST